MEYRAWNKEKQVMVYNREDNEQAWWDGVCITDIEMVNARLESEYSPYIYMMWTGKYDKNGVKVYQGDIIKTGEFIEEIRFGEYEYMHGLNFNTVGFYVNSKHGIMPFAVDVTEKSEVIGNIYKNVDLIIE